MANKENKGGLLTNEQIEQDLKVTGKDKQQGHYQGLQDTGDDKPRDLTNNEQWKKDQDNEDGEN